MPGIFIFGLHPTLKDYLLPALQNAGYEETHRIEQADTVIWSAFAEFAEIEALIEALPGSARKKAIFLSSSAVIGEGDFICGDCGPVPPAPRGEAQFKQRRWEAQCPLCGEMLMPQPAEETILLHPATEHARYFAALEARCQEVQLLCTFPVIRLRLFGPYWPHPHYLAAQNRGVLAHFCRNLLADQSPIIYEDGYQMRDFLYGPDLVQAILNTLTAPDLALNDLFHLGSGTRLTIQETAAYLQEFLGKTAVDYHITERYRAPDARHCFPNIRKARERLGYTPQFDILTGLADFCRQLSPLSSSR